MSSNDAPDGPTEADDGGAVTVGISRLEEFLSADDPEVREYAAETLAVEAADRPDDVSTAVGGLTEALADEPAIRSHAAAALAAVADAHPDAVAEAVPSAVDCLDASATVRGDAAALIASVAAVDPDAASPAIEPLASCLGDDREETRISASEAIAATATANPEVAAAVVDPVAVAIDDEREEVRENVTRTLAAIAEHDPETIEHVLPRVIERLDDGDGVRVEAAATLRSVGTGRPAALTDETAAVAALLDDRLAAVRVDAATALAGVASAEPMATCDAVAELAGATADERRVRRPAVETLAAIAEANPRAVVPAVDDLVGRLTDEDEDVRANAVRTVASVGEVRPGAIVGAVETIVENLDDDAIRRDGVAVVADAAEHEPEAVEPIVRALEPALCDGDEEVRADATRAVAAVASVAPEAVRSLVPALDDRVVDPHEALRVDAARALAAVVDAEPGDSVDVAAQRGHLDDDDAWIGGYAARALSDAATAGSPDTAPAVRAAVAGLDDGNRTVRRHAARTLGEVAIDRPWEARDAVGPLAARLDDDDADVRNAAALALTTIVERYPAALREELGALFGALEDDDRTVARNVERVLAALADDSPDGIRPAIALAAAVAASGDDATAPAAMEALAVLEPRTGREVELAVEAITEGVANPTVAARVAALDALARLLDTEVDADPTPAAAAVRRLSTGDRSVAVARALADVARSDPEALTDAASGLLERVTNAGPAERRAHYRTLRAVVSAKDGRPISRILLARLEDGDREGIAAELAGLASTAPADAVAVSDEFEALLDDDDEAVGGYATLGLAALVAAGELPESRLSRSLDAVDDRLLDVASLVAGGERPDEPDAVERQMDGLADRLDGDAWAGGLAVLALETLAAGEPTRRERGVEHLADALDASDPVVSVTAARALERLADAHPSAVATVASDLAKTVDAEANGVDLTAAAGSALVACLDELATVDGAFVAAVEPTCRRALAAPDARIRTNAARALGIVGTDHRAALEALTDDPVPEASEAAASALERLAAASEERACEDDESSAGSTAWSMARGGLGGAGFANVAAPAGELRGHWSIEAEGEAAAAPAIADGRVYVPCGPGGLLALSLSDGSNEWRFEAAGAVRRPPAVGTDAVVVAADDGALYALDPDTGERSWRYRSGASTTSAPVVAGDRVFAGDEDGRLHAVDLETGIAAWSRAIEDDATEALLRPAVDDEGIYAASADGVVAAYDRSGDRRWRRDLGASAVAAPAVLDDRLVVRAGDGTLAVLSSDDGAVTSRFAVGGPGDVPPAAADGTVYIAGDDASVYAIDASTGTERWRSALLEGRPTELVVLRDAVYATTNRGTLLALRRDDGERYWEHRTDGTVVDLAIAGDAVATVDGDGLSLLTSGDGSSGRLSGLLTRFGNGSN